MSADLPPTHEASDDQCRELLDRYAHAIDASAEGVWEWDIASDTMYLSERAQALNGLSPGATIRPRSQWRQLVTIHRDDAPIARSHAEACRDGLRPNIDAEWRVRQPDGSYRWLHTRGIRRRPAAGLATMITGSVIDIDERRRAQDELERNRSYLDEALRLGRAGSFSWSIDRHAYVHWSEQLHSIWAIPVGSGSPDLATLWNAVHPDDRRRVATARLQAVSEGDVFDQEFRIRALDGVAKHVHVVGRIRQGQETEMVGIARDVTDEKRAELKLRESEVRYERVLQASSGGIFEWDPRTDEMFMSPRARELYGVPEAFPFKTRQDLRHHGGGMHPLDAPRVDSILRDTLNQNRSNYLVEHRIIYPNQEVRWVASQAMIFSGTDGSPTRLVGVVTDINLRKQAEEDLKSRQELLELAQQVARATVIEWTMGAHPRTHWSAELKAMFEISGTAADSAERDWTAFVEESDREHVRQAISLAISSGQIDTEFRLGGHASALRWLHTKGRIFFGEDEQPKRMVGFVLDITDRKRAEAAVARLERQIKQAQRLESIGTLAGGIAHDFNNILGAILGYSEIALADVAGLPQNSRLRRDLTRIQAAGERGKALVDRILMFTKSARGERKAVNIAALAREVLDLLSPRLPPDVVLDLRVHAPAAHTMGNPAEIHQVLMNLCTNAFQAMPRGGTLKVEVSVARYISSVATLSGTMPPGEYVLVMVGDTGAGIPPAHFERIFDPFFTTKDVGVGTGLGLTLVHRIVTELGGTIDIQSTLDVGTNVCVSLPRCDDHTGQPEPPLHALPRGAAQSIAVVDDEESLVALTSEILSSLGYQVQGFTSGVEFLEVLRSTPPAFDVLITDAAMPGLSGTDLIDLARDIRPELVTLLVSGNLTARLEHQAIQAGAHALLSKPLSMRELATAVARALAG